MNGKLILSFDANVVEQPIIYKLIKIYDLMVNILKANIDFDKRGTMLVEIEGDRLEEGIDYLKSLGIGIRPLAQEVIRDDKKCIQCSACVTLCPTGALSVKRDTMEVIFTSQKCLICRECVRSCPQRAMEVRF